MDHSKCMFSTGIDESLTAGQGKLDEMGFWEIPCEKCKKEMEEKLSKKETNPEEDDMGTRAQFFIGNPCDVEKRKWLGCVAWDGYPDGDLNSLKDCTDEQSFIETLSSIMENRSDFCDPNKHDFPFPWLDDVFLTDCTYAFYDGKVIFNSFHNKPVEMKAYMNMSDEELDLIKDVLPRNIKASRNIGKEKGPDSIMIISATNYHLRGCDEQQ